MILPFLSTDHAEHLLRWIDMFEVSKVTWHRKFPIVEQAKAPVFDRTIKRSTCEQSDSDARYKHRGNWACRWYHDFQLTPDA